MGFDLLWMITLTSSALRVGLKTLELDAHGLRLVRCVDCVGITGSEFPASEDAHVCVSRRSACTTQVGAKDAITLQILDCRY